MSEATQEVIVNGERRTVPTPLTVAGLLRHLEVRPKGTAVERNKRLVPRAEHEKTPVEAGDELEIVTFVGGG